MARHRSILAQATRPARALTLKSEPESLTVLVMGADPATWPSPPRGDRSRSGSTFSFSSPCSSCSPARDLGWRRTLGWLVWGFAVAFSAEFASTRVGIPFGLYHYTGATAGRELFISNVPFFDPLSFPFLAYASFCLARWALGPGRRMGARWPWPASS